MYTYLNGWGNLVGKLSIILKMMALRRIKYSMAKVMLTVKVSPKSLMI